MSGMVKLDVGESRAPFDVHLELLCSCSPYFDHFFRKRTEEALDNQAIHLPNFEIDTFAEIVLWMYRGEQSLRPLHKRTMHFLLKLWLLAKDLEMARMQNSREILCPDAINLVYLQTLPSSPLRHFVVDVYIHRSKVDRNAINFQHAPRQFLEDICSVLLGERREEKQWTEPTLFSLDQPNRYFVSQSAPSQSPVQTGFGSFSEDSLVKVRLATTAQMSCRKIKKLPARDHKAIRAGQKSDRGNRAEEDETLLPSEP
jgi:hypothetical protein